MRYPRRNLPLNALRAFESVARERSFTGAARDLGVAQSAVSRHIARLEGIVGRKLFVRASKGVRPTEAAEALLAVVARSFDSLSRGLERAVAGTALRLTVPPGFIQGIGAPVLQQFRSLRPDVSLAVSSITAVGMPDAEFDIAVIFDRTDPDVEDRLLLWDVELVPVCANADRERIAALGLTGALREENLLHVELSGYPTDFLWNRFARNFDIEQSRSSSMSFGTYALAEEFAKSGAGMTLADLRSFRADADANRLGAPFDVSAPSGFSYYLVTAASADKKAGALDLREHLRLSAQVSSSGGSTGGPRRCSA